METITFDEEPTDSLTCPKCGAPMVSRIAKRGPHAGKRFWGCSTFPNCRATRASHPVGSTLGIPATQSVKMARKRAHVVFDRLWQEGWMTRDQAYKYIDKKIWHNPHIDSVDTRVCALIESAAQRFLDDNTEKQTSKQHRERLRRKCKVRMGLLVDNGGMTKEGAFRWMNEIMHTGKISELTPGQCNQLLGHISTQLAFCKVIDDSNEAERVELDAGEVQEIEDLMKDW